MLFVLLFTCLAAVTDAFSQVPVVNQLAVPNGERATGTLTDFIATEGPIALQGVLNNIGSTGSKAAGTESGLVVASPSRSDPDYFYAWTRDSALTFKALVDAFIIGNAALQPDIEDYIYSQAQLQAVSNPSGSLYDGAGLGEPKFEVDGTAFTGAWGRPQRDGPALRATSLIAYSRWLLGNGGVSFVTSVIWPIVYNDLNYVAQYWNETTFDLWEEISGSSFFTTAVQHRALSEGITFAEQIGKTYWNGQYITANVNGANSRSSKDVNTILASVHTFDPSAGCDDRTFQPCSGKALANHKVVTDSFRTVFPINSGKSKGSAVAVGRYPEDVYQGGNPWYLANLAAAEQLYDALYQWSKIGSLNVSTTNLDFFQAFSPAVVTGTYTSSTSTYVALTTAIKAYADDYLSIVAQYTPANGSLAEQFSRDDGTPLSAGDLTWSYAAFLTAVARRNGQMSAPWGASSANTVPTTCSGTSAQGSYVTPTATAPLPPCTTVTSVAVVFNAAETTTYGEVVFIAGSISQLGNWNAADAVALSAVDYQSGYPRWFVSINLPAVTQFQYKFLKKTNDGEVIWEDGPNRSFTVPEGCAAEVWVHDTWH